MLPDYFPLRLRRYLECGKTLLWRREVQSNVHSSMLGWLFSGINLVGVLGLRGRGGRFTEAALEGD